MKIFGDGVEFKFFGARFSLRLRNVVENVGDIARGAKEVAKDARSVAFTTAAVIGSLAAAAAKETTLEAYRKKYRLDEVETFNREGTDYFLTRAPELSEWLEEHPHSGENPLDCATGPGSSIEGEKFYLAKEWASGIASLWSSDEKANDTDCMIIKMDDQMERYQNNVIKWDDIGVVIFGSLTVGLAVTTMFCALKKYLKKDQEAIMRVYGGDDLRKSKQEQEEGEPDLENQGKESTPLLTLKR